MYKAQLRFQRIVCIAAVMAAALWFVYSLGFITDMYDALYFTMQNPDDLSETLVPGSIIYYEMQGFNRAMLYSAIGLILLACLLFLTGTHSRRRYYIGNFVSVTLFCAGSAVLSLWSHAQIDAFRTQFLTMVDFDSLQMWSEIFPTIVYSESTLLLDLHYAVMGVSAAVIAALIANIIWKLAAERSEARLIKQGTEAI